MVKVEWIILVKNHKNFQGLPKKNESRMGVELSFLSKKDHTCLAEISWWVDSWLQ
ncbi:MAG: hypothetical protein ACT4NJ_08935 [Nitrosopumilaceae archaeon]